VVIRAVSAGAAAAEASVFQVVGGEDVVAGGGVFVGGAALLAGLGVQGLDAGVGGHREMIRGLGVGFAMGT
jgi:hypothetical protein